MNKKTKELNRKNNELDQLIFPENKEATTNIVCYLRGANISEYDQEVVRNDLLEMIVAAQKRGEGVKDVIGTDENSEKTFCEEVIAALPPRTIWQRILYGIDLLLLCFAILAAINIVLSKTTFTLLADAITGKTLDFQLSITAGGLFSFGLIIVSAVFIVGLIMKTSLKKTAKPPLRKSMRFLIGGVVGVGMIGIFLLIAWFGRAELFTVNIFAACLFALLSYLLHLLISKWT
ncbi:MAG TPA: hypothetical protein PKD52_02670 [Clostridiales bacterium]|nr:hypothetical protein [Clostridiales bacterium]